jgi:hypothetical protein
MIFQFPLPPDIPVDPPGVVFQLFACFVVVLLFVESIILALPDRWRQKVCELQFGAGWTARNK